MPTCAGLDKSEIAVVPGTVRPLGLILKIRTAVAPRQ
jgi:hypothetical protein